MRKDIIDLNLTKDVGKGTAKRSLQHMPHAFKMLLLPWDFNASKIVSQNEV